jgi:hypothetical protein
MVTPTQHTGVQFQEPSFETPVVVGQQQAPVGSLWTWAGTAGIVANGGMTGLPNAPDGVQAAYITGSSASFLQAVNFDADGMYTLTFQDSQLVGASGSSKGKFTVQLDGANLGQFVPNSSSYGPDGITNPFLITAGSHTFTFIGSSNTSLIDAIQLTFISIPVNDQICMILDEMVGHIVSAGLAGSNIHTQHLQRAATIKDLLGS